MTTDQTSPAIRTAPRAERNASAAGSLMLTIAGGALVAGTLLYVGGMATSPPAASMAPADYIDSLARDEGRTTLSAMLLHYGNMAMGLAWLAAPALVRGRRGVRSTVTGALLSAIGLVTVAGFVLYDFWTGTIGQQLDRATAVALFEAVHASPGAAIVGTVHLLGLLGPLVAYAGLARAGVTSWWLLAPAVASLAIAMALPFTPLLFAGISLIGAVPAVLVGLRMVQRGRTRSA